MQLIRHTFKYFEHTIRIAYSEHKKQAYFAYDDVKKALGTDAFVSHTNKVNVLLFGEHVCFISLEGLNEIKKEIPDSDERQCFSGWVFNNVLRPVHYLSASEKYNLDRTDLVYNIDNELWFDSHVFTDFYCLSNVGFSGYIGAIASEDTEGSTYKFKKYTIYKDNEQFVGYRFNLAIMDKLLKHFNEPEYFMYNTAIRVAINAVKANKDSIGRVCMTTYQNKFMIFTWFDSLDALHAFVKYSDYELIYTSDRLKDVAKYPQLLLNKIINKYGDIDSVSPKKALKIVEKLLGK